jgi:hypothetical protein
MKDSMTINKLISLLKGAKQDIHVYFSFCSCIPTEIASWRGIYAEPALGWSPSGYYGEYPTVESLIKELESAITHKGYCGWKGGDFYYNGDEPLHIDNEGECTYTEISDVEIKEWEVIIHTINNNKLF